MRHSSHRNRPLTSAESADRPHPIQQPRPMSMRARLSGVEGGTRLRVLTAVRSATDPVRVDQLAQELAIHPNTVRFHLESLQAEGTVERSEQRSGGRGRPSAVYAATPAAGWLGRRDPVLLSQILIEGAENSAADGSSAQVWEAGRRWGRERAAGGDSGAGAGAAADADSGAVREAILRHLEETGFEPGAERSDAEDTGGSEGPGASGDSGRTRIPLLNCAFADLADTHRDSVCSLHAGMLEGVRQAVDADGWWDVELHPFVTPSVCEVIVCCRSGAAGDR